MLALHLQGLEAVRLFEPVREPNRTNRTDSFGSVPVQVRFSQGTFGSVPGSSKIVEEPN